MPDNNTREIREDFKRKSNTYFEKNYLANKNQNRQFRLMMVRDLIRSLNVSGKDFLDAGAGPGVLGEIVKESRGNYYASDISIHNIIASRERLGDFPGVVADTCDLPFRNHSFDFVFSIGSLEYIEDVAKAVKEICRVVKPGGVVVFTVASSYSPGNWINDRILLPFKARKRKKTNQPLYKRYFSTIPKVRNMLRQSGFHIDEYRYFTPGLFDNQLKKISFFRKTEKLLVERIPFLNRTSKEILFVARR